MALPPERLDNVDTDQIIPARFLKGTVKTGLGEKLFCDWRYLENGNPDPAFTLNQPQAKGASILIARHNFGCGSSREHAPWALKDYGFQAVLAVSFADIFKNNALKNRVLPIALPEAVIEKFLNYLSQDSQTNESRLSMSSDYGRLRDGQHDLPQDLQTNKSRLSMSSDYGRLRDGQHDLPQELQTNESRLSVQIDLEHQTVQIAMGETAKASEQFELSAFWKTCLLHGIDDIGYTLQFNDQIAAYEQRIA